jgi:hypothetical protein
LLILRSGKKSFNYLSWSGSSSDHFPIHLEKWRFFMVFNNFLKEEWVYNNQITKSSKGAFSHTVYLIFLNLNIKFWLRTKPSSVQQRFSNYYLLEFKWP